MLQCPAIKTTTLKTKQQSNAAASSCSIWMWTWWNKIGYRTEQGPEIRRPQIIALYTIWRLFLDKTQAAQFNNFNPKQHQPLRPRTKSDNWEKYVLCGLHGGTDRGVPWNTTEEPSGIRQCFLKPGQIDAKPPIDESIFSSIDTGEGVWISVIVDTK